MSQIQSQARSDGEAESEVTSYDLGQTTHPPGTQQPTMNPQIHSQNHYQPSSQVQTCLDTQNGNMNVASGNLCQPAQPQRSEPTTYQPSSSSYPRQQGPYQQLNIPFHISKVPVGLQNWYRKYAKYHHIGLEYMTEPELVPDPSERIIEPNAKVKCPHKCDQVIIQAMGSNINYDILAEWQSLYNSLYYFPMDFELERAQELARPIGEDASVLRVLADLRAQAVTHSYNRDVIDLKSVQLRQGAVRSRIGLWVKNLPHDALARYQAKLRRAQITQEVQQQLYGQHNMQDNEIMNNGQVRSGTGNVQLNQEAWPVLQQHEQDNSQAFQNNQPQNLNDDDFLDSLVQDGGPTAQANNIDSIYSNNSRHSGAQFSQQLSDFIFNNDDGEIVTYNENWVPKFTNWDETESDEEESSITSNAQTYTETASIAPSQTQHSRKSQSIQDIEKQWSEVGSNRY